MELLNFLQEDSSGELSPGSAFSELETAAPRPTGRAKPFPLADEKSELSFGNEALPSSANAESAGRDESALEVPELVLEQPHESLSAQAAQHRAEMEKIKAQLVQAQQELQVGAFSMKKVHRTPWKL